MKIRHKQSGVVLEGQFCACASEVHGVRRTWFENVNTHSQYDKREWEAVAPEPVYEQCVGWLYADIVKDLSRRLDRLERRP